MFPFPRGRTERTTTTLALFPLRTVLFPGGLLPLKVFEQRYVEMTTRCLKEGLPFGVCLITRGGEVATPGSEPAEFANVGTLARIESCDAPQVGILHVATRGETRFQVRHHEIAANGLVVGHVTPIATEPAVKLAARQAPLARLLRAIAARVGPANFPEGGDYEDASWVGYRLAELLPLPLSIKQSMLEINDAGVRIEVLQRFCEQQKLL
jgi:Lon protease-like protein